MMSSGWQRCPFPPATFRWEKPSQGGQGISEPPSLCSIPWILAENWENCINISPRTSPMVKFAAWFLYNISNFAVPSQGDRGDRGRNFSVCQGGLSPARRIRGEKAVLYIMSAMEAHVMTLVQSHGFIIDYAEFAVRSRRGGVRQDGRISLFFRRGP